jgi:MFS family permease
MRLLVDITPLRASDDFRRLWAGQAVSFIGSMMTTAALPFQVYHLTGSSLDVGLLGLAQLAPLILFALIGGAFADRLDKRRLLLVLSVIALGSSGGLAVNAALSHPQLWAVFVLGVMSSAVLGATSPVVRSLLPLLLAEDLRPAAFTLHSTYGSFGMMVGPAVAGVLIGAFGLRAAYATDVGTFLVALAAFARMGPSPPVPGSRPASAGSLFEGVRFLRGSLVMSVFGIDLLAMIFGMPRALFPALTQRLGGGPSLYGLLLSSVACGAFVASLLSGWTGHVRRHGRAVLVAVAAWGAAIATAGLVHPTAVVLALFAVAGGADMTSGVFRSSIAAAVTPDELRGRVSGVEFAVYAGGPVLGDAEAGIVGGLAGVPFAIVSGGLACIASAGLFAAFAPRLTRYMRPDAIPMVKSDHGPEPGGELREPDAGRV